MDTRLTLHSPYPVTNWHGTATGGRDHRDATGPAQRPVWMPWITDSWIATRDCEMAFVEDLRILSSGRRTDHGRSDTTACLDALRCGLSVDELLDRAPGLDPARLVSAYVALEHRRAASEHAWSSIVASGSISALADHGEAAAALIPAVVGRLRAAANHNPISYASAVLRLAAAVDKCRHDTYRVEHALARCAPGSDRGRQLSFLLYQPFGDSMASRDGYLADRVGMLTPSRVAALLGELDDQTAPHVGDRAC